MLGFVIGGLYTLIVLAAGFVAGWWLRSRTNDEVIREVMDEVKARRKPDPPRTSGPIKPLTKEERLLESDNQAKKTAQVLSDL